MPEVLSCLIPTLWISESTKQIPRAGVKGKGASRLPHSRAAEAIAPRVALERMLHPDPLALPSPHTFGGSLSHWIQSFSLQPLGRAHPTPTAAITYQSQTHLPGGVQSQPGGEQLRLGPSSEKCRREQESSPSLDRPCTRPALRPEQGIPSCLPQPISLPGNESSSNDRPSLRSNTPPPKDNLMTSENTRPQPHLSGPFPRAAGPRRGIAPVRTFRPLLGSFSQLHPAVLISDTSPA